MDEYPYRKERQLRSKIYIVRSVVNRIKDVLDIIYRDRVSVYAAQASFFVITSSVPFISLLIAIFGLFLPEANDLSHLSIPIIEDVSKGISVIFSSIMLDLKDAPSVSLLSISAVTTLWTASRGIAAIRQGIETVYGTDKTSGYVRHRMTSILTTLLFIVSLTVITVLLLFGDKLISLISGYISVHLTDLFELLRMPALALVMAVFFTAMYCSIAAKSSYVSHKVWRHIPGGLFSSVGWLVFSYLYSLYINHFPGASKVYGSLSAVCLIMLWLYFCMMILLLGAELNKLCFAGKGASVMKNQP